MPQILDNIDLLLLPAVRHTLEVADRADFCVGYFNLRGWKQLAPLVDRWEGGDEHCWRLLIGMNRPPEEELRAALTRGDAGEEIDNQTALRLNRNSPSRSMNSSRSGAPTNEDEAGLRQMAAQAPSLRQRLIDPRPPQTGNRQSTISSVRERDRSRRHPPPSAPKTQAQQTGWRPVLPFQLSETSLGEEPSCP